MLFKSLPSRLALLLVLTAGLSACGGGGSGGESTKNPAGDIGFGVAPAAAQPDTSTPTDPTAGDDDTETPDESPAEPSGPTVASLIVSASSLSLNSDADVDPATEGSEPISIYMMAKDENNIALSGVTFAPSVENGATLYPDTTSSDGIVTVWKLVPDEPRNQTVKVTVTAGDMTETLNIDIIGTNLQVDGPDSISMDKPSTYTVKLKDAAGEGLAQQAVAISSPLITQTLTTDTEGEAQFEVQPTSGGKYEIKATALGTVGAKSITVSPNAFNLSSNISEIPVGASQPVKLTWTANGVPQSGKTIHLSATRGEITVSGNALNHAVTNSAGIASFELRSHTAGGTVVTATDNTTFLSTSLPLEYISTTPNGLSIQSSPSIIAALGTSTIMAKVNDANDNPVKGQTVVFNLNDTVDGSLSSSKAETDSAGQASIVYTAGSRISKKDGVVITSHIEGRPSITDKTTLTVGGNASRIVFGFDENLSENGIFYNKPFGVVVTDNAGNPVSGKKIDFTVTPVEYYKGYLTYDPVVTAWSQVITAGPCAGEDLDLDGWLDPGEDFNNSGTLEPTNAATIVSSGTTNESGEAQVSISYPQNHALWNRVRITAQITVSGTEYIENIYKVLPVLASDMDRESTPPNHRSPYGSGSCSEPPNN